MDCQCDAGFQGEMCDRPCDLTNNALSISFVFDTSGSLSGNKPEVQQNFVNDLIDQFDTQNNVDVSIINVGDCQGGWDGVGEQMEVVFPQGNTSIA